MDAQTTPKQTAKKVRRLFTTSLIGAAALASAMAGPATAAEIGSGGGGGGGGGTTACNPVSSLSVKSDPRVGETGLATTQASYSVKACTNGQALKVETSVREYLNPTSVPYDNTEAPLNGKFTVAIKIRTTYIVKVEAFDAVTGASAGSLTAYTAAVPKGV